MTNVETMRGLVERAYAARAEGNITELMAAFHDNAVFEFAGRDFEAGRREPTRNNLAAMKAALETGGISFLESETVRGISVRR